MVQETYDTMSLTDALLATGTIPDALIRFSIRRRLANTLKEHVASTAEAQRQRVMAHVDDLRASPIAINTAEANEQHYEVPTQFYQYALGPRLKYSSAWFDSPQDTLAEAEEKMVKAGVVSNGDLIVVTFGEPIGSSGGTNTMKIVKVGEDRRP